jgi:GTP-binding protein
MIERYLSSRENLKAVVVILDIRRAPNEEDAQLLDWLARREISSILVVTKADKLSKTAQLKQLKIIAGALETDPDDLVLFSSKSRQGRDVLWRTLVELATAPPEDERA